MDIGDTPDIPHIIFPVIRFEYFRGKPRTEYGTFVGFDRQDFAKTAYLARPDYLIEADTLDVGTRQHKLYPAIDLVDGQAQFVDQCLEAHSHDRCRRLCVRRRRHFQKLLRRQSQRQVVQYGRPEGPEIGCAFELDTVYAVADTAQ